MALVKTDEAAASPVSGIQLINSYFLDVFMIDGSAHTEVCAENKLAKRINEIATSGYTSYSPSDHQEFSYFPFTQILKVVTRRKRP